MATPREELEAGIQRIIRAEAKRMERGRWVDTRPIFTAHEREMDARVAAARRGEPLERLRAHDKDSTRAKRGRTETTDGERAFKAYMRSRQRAEKGAREVYQATQRADRLFERWGVQADPETGLISAPGVTRPLRRTASEAQILTAIANAQRRAGEDSTSARRAAAYRRRQGR